ncbi:MAG: electron transfer flavoprotein subunit beta/FixA family protein [Proteobacteria bacterium]|nr:electron transfer flavoprotein subunit beta/FixA family protein [Pseudomonadota bacterium]MBU1452457.1 electron transfer flavoprotein subunit beta/FixA family protein [Pseudomonadota bacterium]MBU2467724.1 electron transfer flavoprotein subunit beta/FixA family protein [Pseudomonadota bacterium]MBU2518276.1 electron transfer flavoprotein subunit beta/FixA family protein [Pseudomonadota bacterium]
MNIVVCVKQVPEISEVKVNPETGTLVREGVASILNPFCEYALDHALRIKQATPDVNITAISMGPPQARAALLRALELGADRGVLVSDRRFAGADTWATALTLAAAVRAVREDFDLILVGKQAIDGDTAQVGPEMAEILGIPQIMYGVRMELTPNGKRLRVKRESENGYQVLEARLPVLVSASKGEAIRRLPSFADILAARQKPLEMITADALNLSEEQLGLQGSYTQVVKIFPPQAKKACRKLEGLSPDQAGREITSFLSQENFI